MKRYLAALVAVAVAAVLVAAPAQASEPLPRPAPDDPSVITTAGTYDQEQADANRATYLALQDYVDQQDANWRFMVRGLNDNIVALIKSVGIKGDQIAALYGTLAQKQAAIDSQQKVIDSQRAVLGRRAAKLAELRETIRDLRD